MIQDHAGILLFPGEFEQKDKHREEWSQNDQRISTGKSSNNNRIGFV